MSHVPDESPLDLVSRHIWTDHGLGTGPATIMFIYFPLIFYILQHFVPCPGGFTVTSGLIAPGPVIAGDIDILTRPATRHHPEQDLFTVHTKIYCLNTSEFT